MTEPTRKQVLQRLHGGRPIVVVDDDDPESKPI